MAIAAPGRAAAPTRVISSVPSVAQPCVLDCETAALQMALAHEGGHVTRATLLSRERVSPAPPGLAGAWTVRRGDPSTRVVGSVHGPAAHPPTGYGPHAPGIARGARAVGGDGLWSGTGLALTRLEPRSGPATRSWSG